MRHYYKHICYVLNWAGNKRCSFDRGTAIENRNNHSWLDPYCSLSSRPFIWVVRSWCSVCRRSKRHHQEIRIGVWRGPSSTSCPRGNWLILTHIDKRYPVWIYLTSIFRNHIQSTQLKYFKLQSLHACFWVWASLLTYSKSTANRTAVDLP